MDVTRTTTLLLEGLHDRGNATAWSEFDQRYRPILFGFLRALGANETDAADVAQETLLHFLEQYRRGQYDRERGRLRTWIITIARTQLALMRRRAAARREQGAMLESQDADTDTAAPDPEARAQQWNPEWDRLWEQERRQVILRNAFAHLSAESKTGEPALQAFELLVFRAVPAAAVAKELGMSLADVYQSKSRVTARLRDHIELLEKAFEESEM